MHNFGLMISSGAPMRAGGPDLPNGFGDMVAQAQWAEKENISITLASDLNKKTAADYGVLLDDLLGLGSVSARAAFVIDKEGTVQYAEQTETPKDLPNFDAIKEALSKLN